MAPAPVGGALKCLHDRVPEYPPTACNQLHIRYSAPHRTKPGAEMARACSFCEADLKHAIRAARCAGLDVSACKINPRTGEITILTPKAGPAD